MDSALSTALRPLPSCGVLPSYGSSGLETRNTEWYALRTKPHTEKAVREMLEWHNVECYLPLAVRRRRVDDQRKQGAQPLFPGYLFCHTSLRIPFRIVSIPGVLGFVGCAGTPAPVPDDQILALRCLEDSRRALRSGELFTEGQKVRVCSGALKGLVGSIQKVKREDLLVVSIELLRRAVYVSIEADCVEWV